MAGWGGDTPGPEPARHTPMEDGMTRDNRRNIWWSAGAFLFGVLVTGATFSANIGAKLEKLDNTAARVEQVEVRVTANEKVLAVVSTKVENVEKTVVRIETKLDKALEAKADSGN